MDLYIWNEESLLFKMWRKDMISKIKGHYTCLCCGGIHKGNADDYLRWRDGLVLPCKKVKNLKSKL